MVLCTLRPFSCLSSRHLKKHPTQKNSHIIARSLQIYFLRSLVGFFGGGSARRSSPATCWNKWGRVRELKEIIWKWNDIIFYFTPMTSILKISHLNGQTTPIQMIQNPVNSYQDVKYHLKLNFLISIPYEPWVMYSFLMGKKTLLKLIQITRVLFYFPHGWPNRLLRLKYIHLYPQLSCQAH